MQRRATVIGAGISGLTLASLLAHRGYAVTVLEQSDRPGGRAAQAIWDGFTFDLGPTLLFMLDVYREAFARWGADFDRLVPTVRLRPNYRLHWPDGAALTVSPVLSETIASLETLAPGSSKNLLAYLASAARAYELSRKEFVGERIRSFAHFLTPRKIAGLFAAGAFSRLGAAAKAAFGSERVANAFSFQSMYLGMSPYDSPLLYRLLLFTELGEGIHFPIGGIGSLARALERSAIDLGVAIHYGEAATAFERDARRVTAVRTASGRYACDLVACSADLPYVYETLLGETRHRSLRMAQTPSALLIYLGLDRGYGDLLHHEFLMPSSLRDTCDDIFARGAVPRDPAIYLCAPATTDPSMAPPGGEALYVLVPSPNLRGSTDWRSQTPALAQRILETIERRRLPGLRSRIRFMRTRTPLDFRHELNLNDGAAFGLSHDVLQIGPLRPDNRHKRLKNLFFTGASTRPATGLPLVTLSAMQTADRIFEEIPA
ncbi:MAG TPA: phytoene desaturase family protein [Candidatus Aquilonibacter sp.]|nr:phytoene desaturase family protein [Candidatus Aquilonibacter sp.]